MENNNTEQTQLNNVSNKNNNNVPAMDWREEAYYKLDEIVNTGEEFTLDSFVTLTHPENGEYIIMHLIDQNGNRMNVTVGSKIVIEKLNKAKVADKLPQGAKFFKNESANGRSYFTVV